MLPPTIHFSKLNSAGNDFICLDNTQGIFTPLLESPLLPDFVRSLCRRGLSIGADGILFAERCQDGCHADIWARFLEPDGSEAELCGNGTACFTYWVTEKGLTSGPEITIATAAGTAWGKIRDHATRRVRVCIPDPQDLQTNLNVTVHGEPWQLDTVTVGVPHAVIYVDDLETLDVAHWGPAIRWHEQFQPRGINVNFVQVLGVGHLAVRTFEFGVEKETLACGTGSASAAILTTLRQNWPEAYRTGDEPVHVQVRSGESLRVWFTCNHEHIATEVCLETHVKAIYDGSLRPELMRDLGNSDSVKNS
jgi:diaminopimelate epimerase